MPKPQQQKPKPRPVGRPKLHDRAKSTTVLVRLSPEDRQRVEAAAKASNQTLSDWIRSTLNAALGG
jgi:predicted HicB family RNase H-like nuclease